MMKKERKREREKKTHEESEIKIQICKNSKKQTCVGEYLLLLEGTGIGEGVWNGGCV